MKAGGVRPSCGVGWFICIFVDNRIDLMLLRACSSTCAGVAVPPSICICKGCGVTGIALNHVLMASLIISVFTPGAAQ